ncbi:MAG: ATP-binding protein [Polyangiales bacterium]
MQKRPSDVFTPRNPDVNEVMYVPRPFLEKAFRRAIESGKHVLVYGESGCGKSWLYKRTLYNDGAAMVVANLANASRHESIVKEIETVTSELLDPIRTVYTESKSAEASAFGFAKGSLEHESTYQLPQGDPLERCFSALRRAAGEKTCCLVLDNLETIFSNERLMSELGEIVVLLDDARYARHRIKLVIVGVPGGVREYFWLS